MKKELNANSLICLCLFFLSPSFAIGDIAPNPVSAPNLKPLSPTSVRMVSEVVTVDLYQDSSVVEVLFEMKNLWETETMEVGFPIMDFYFGWKTSLFVRQKSEGERFKVWIDGEPVKDIKVSYPEGNLGATPWYIWNTTFPQGETQWIKVRYSLPKGTNKRNNFFNYLLHTGANWNETIGEATIKVNIHDIPDQDIRRITPAGYTKDENMISWTFTDFEPTVKEDIFIYYRKDPEESWRENADVYLDNKKFNFADLDLIDPEDIAYFRVKEADTLNFPHGVIFINTKQFDFVLLKEFVRKISLTNYKELAALEVNEFYSNYVVEITGGETKKGESYHDLSVDDIVSITIDHKNDQNQVIITKQ